MADVTNEPIYEVLKKLQDEVVNVRVSQRTQAEETSAIRGHVLAVQKDIHNLYEVGSDTNRRLDRIEQRLGLLDEKV